MIGAFVGNFSNVRTFETGTNSPCETMTEANAYRERSITIGRKYIRSVQQTTTSCPTRIELAVLKSWNVPTVYYIRGGEPEGPGNSCSEEQSRGKVLKPWEHKREWGPLMCRLIGEIEHAARFKCAKPLGNGEELYPNYADLFAAGMYARSIAWLYNV